MARLCIIFVLVLFIYVGALWNTRARIQGLPLLHVTLIIYLSLLLVISFPFSWVSCSVLYQLISSPLSNIKDMSVSWGEQSRWWEVLRARFRRSSWCSWVCSTWRRESWGTSLSRSIEDSRGECWSLSGDQWEDMRRWGKTVSDWTLEGSSLTGWLVTAMVSPGKGSWHSAHQSSRNICTMFLIIQYSFRC